VSTDRWIGLEGAVNVRELGGLPLRGGGTTRAGVLLRADTLQELTEADVEWLLAWGVRSVLDLRAPEEARREGRGPLAEQPLAYANLAFIPDAVIVVDDPGHALVVAERNEQDRVEHYLDYLRGAGPAVVAALEWLAGPAGVPAVFHCAAGKDRTGVLAALVLDLNGVEREAVIADYARSNERLDAVLGRLLRMPTYSHYTGTRRSTDLACEPHVMEQFLARLDAEHGGAAGWVRAAGMSEDSIARVSRLLHPATARPATARPTADDNKGAGAAAVATAASP